MRKRAEGNAPCSYPTYWHRGFYAREHCDITVANEEKGKVTSTEGIIANLLETALILSLRLNDPRSTTKAWSKLLREMLRIWPQIGDFIAPAFLHLVFGSPASQLQEVWLVLLTLRASQPNAL